MTANHLIILNSTGMYQVMVKDPLTTGTLCQWVGCKAHSFTFTAIVFRFVHFTLIEVVQVRIPGDGKVHKTVRKGTIGPITEGDKAPVLGDKCCEVVHEDRHGGHGGGDPEQGEKLALPWSKLSNILKYAIIVHCHISRHGDTELSYAVSIALSAQK